MSISYGGDSVNFADGSSLASGRMGMVNRIINGDMRVSQRNGTSSFSQTNGAYSLDRWYGLSYAGGLVTGKYTVAQSSNAPAGFTNSLLVTSSAATSSTSADIYAIAQAVEGFNIADFGWGTANARPANVTFWVKSSTTGTFGLFVRNNQLDYSYPATYTITAANTWEQKTINIPAPTSGTWPTDNSAGLFLWFQLQMGSSWLGTPNTWTSSAVYGATGCVNFLNTNGATWQVTGVDLRAGTYASAPTWEFRSFAQELALCQRYYETSYSIGTPVGADLAPASFRAVCNATYASSSYFGSVVFKVYKRAEPTIIFYSGTTSGSLACYTTGGASNQTVTAQNVNQFGCSAVISSVTGLQFAQGNWIAGAEL